MLAAQTHAIIWERQFCDVRHPQGVTAWLSFTTRPNVQLRLLGAGRGAVSAITERKWVRSWERPLSSLSLGHIFRACLWIQGKLFVLLIVCCCNFSCYNVEVGKRFILFGCTWNISIKQNQRYLVYSELCVSILWGQASMHQNAHPDAGGFPRQTAEQAGTSSSSTTGFSISKGSFLKGGKSTHFRHYIIGDQSPTMSHSVSQCHSGRSSVLASAVSSIFYPKMKPSQKSLPLVCRSCTHGLVFPKQPFLMACSSLPQLQNCPQPCLFSVKWRHSHTLYSEGEPLWHTERAAKSSSQSKVTSWSLGHRGGSARKAAFLPVCVAQWLSFDLMNQEVTV